MSAGPGADQGAVLWEGTAQRWALSDHLWEEACVDKLQWL